MRIATWILTGLAIVLALPTLWIVWNPPTDGGSLLIMIGLAFLLFCLALPAALLGLFGFLRARKRPEPRGGALAAFIVSNPVFAASLVLDFFALTALAWH